MASVVASPIKINDSSLKLLSSMAASDAEHDFDTSTGRFFSPIFFAKKKSTGAKKINDYKEIGTVRVPETAWDTWGTLEEVTKKNEKESTLVYKGDFIEGYLSKEKVIEKTIEINPRFSDTTKYTMRSFYFGTKEEGAKENDFRGVIKAEDFFNAITANYKNKPKTIYCQIDATNISWDDYFNNDRMNPIDNIEKTEPIICFVNSREGQNDPASGKMNLSDKMKDDFKKKKVVLTTVEETPDSLKNNMLYTTLKSEGPQSVFNNFNSIYNLQLGPIITNGKVKQVCLTFLDENNKTICVLNEGKTENAKTPLNERLKSFFKSLLKPSGPSIQDKNSYFTALQQKRGGDWLQVLCTYDKKRFGIDQDSPFILITHDLICLSYALAMGVDAIFTRQEEKKIGGKKYYSKYALFFQNKIRESGIEKDKLIENLRKQEANISALILDIYTSRETYETSREKIIGSKVKQLETSFDPSKLEITENLIDQIRTNIRKYFSDMFELSLALHMFPDIADLEEGRDEVFFDTTVLTLITTSARTSVVNTKMMALIKSLDSVQVDKGILATQSNEFLELLPDINAFEKLEKILMKISNSYKMYKSEKDGIVISQPGKLDILGMKTKSKNIEGINAFLKYLDPFPTTKVGGVFKAVINRFDTSDEKNKQDYSALNFFTGDQLKVKETNYVEEIINIFDPIAAKLKEAFDSKNEEAKQSGLASRQAKAFQSRFEIAIKQFEKFKKDIVSYLTVPPKSETRTLEDGVLAKMLVEINQIVENQRGDEPASLGGKIFKESDGESILEYSSKTFSEEDPKLWKKDIADRRWKIISQALPDIGPIDTSFEIAYKSFYDILVYNERDIVVFEKIFEKKLGDPETWKEPVWNELKKEFPRKFKNENEFKKGYKDYYNKILLTIMASINVKYPTWMGEKITKPKDIESTFPVIKQDTKFFEKYNQFLIDIGVKSPPAPTTAAPTTAAPTTAAPTTPATTPAPTTPTWAARLKQSIRKATPPTTPPPTPIILNVNTTMEDAFRDQQVGKEQAKDLQSQLEAENLVLGPAALQGKFVTSSPYSMYLKTILDSRSDIQADDTIETIFKNLRSANPQGTQGGGGKANEYSIPYNGFITMYLHKSATLSQLYDLDSILNGWDFDLLAIKAQTFISLQEAIEPTVEALANELGKTKEIERYAIYYTLSKYCDSLFTYILPNIEETVLPIADTNQNPIFPTWFRRNIMMTNSDFLGSSSDDTRSVINIQSPYLTKYLENFKTILSRKSAIPAVQESLPRIQNELQRSIFSLVKQAALTEEQTKTRIYKDILLAQPGMTSEQKRFIEENLEYQNFVDVRFLLDNDLIDGGNPSDPYSKSILHNFEEAKRYVYATHNSRPPLFHEPTPRREVTVAVTPAKLQEQFNIELALEKELKEKEDRKKELIAQYEENIRVITNPTEKKARIDTLISALDGLMPSAGLRSLKRKLYTQEGIEEVRAAVEPTAVIAIPQEQQVLTQSRGGGKKKNRRSRKTRKHLRLKSRRRTHKK